MANGDDKTQDEKHEEAKQQFNDTSNLDCALARMAEELNLEPTEVRRRALMFDRDGEMPQFY